MAAATTTTTDGIGQVDRTGVTEEVVDAVEDIVHDRIDDRIDRVVEGRLDGVDRVVHETFTGVDDLIELADDVERGDRMPCAGGLPVRSEGERHQRDEGEATGPPSHGAPPPGVEVLDGATRSRWSSASGLGA